MGKFALDMDMVDPGKRSTIAKSVEYDKINIAISVDVKDSQDPLTLQKMADAGGDVLKKKRQAITQELLSLCEWVKTASLDEQVFRSESPAKFKNADKSIQSHVTE